MKTVLHQKGCRKFGMKNKVNLYLDAKNGCTYPAGLEMEHGNYMGSTITAQPLLTLSSHSSWYEFKLHVRHLKTTHEIRIVNIPTAKMLQGNYLELPKMRNTLLNTAHLFLLY